MKIVAKIFLLLFIVFLVTPTIITVIEKSANVSVFYDLSEEEHFHTEIVVFNYTALDLNGSISLKVASTAILSEKLSKHDKIPASIFIPPPNNA